MSYYLVLTSNSDTCVCVCLQRRRDEVGQREDPQSPADDGALRR